MATFTRQFLSAGPNGIPVKVAATSIGSPTTVHTAHATGKDQVYLFVTNSSTSPVALTVGWGGTTDPDSLIVNGLVIPPKTDCMPIPIIPGIPITGGLSVVAAAGTANVLILTGWVDRIL